LAIKPYRWLARYYDEIFASFRLPIDSARKRALGRILPQVRAACDLACGTGATALDLARQGIKVYAVDLSPLMCQAAACGQISFSIGQELCQR
jgi:2-polyprenyl-3-methyl-5-hydroxy-6-metoxy-1,4-benzoquinol methylase